MRYLFTILIFIMLSACHRNTAPQVNNSIKTKDSIVYKEVLRDTTIYLPGAEIYWRDTINTPCPEWNFDSTSTKDNVKLHVNVTNGKLTAKCEADSLKRVISWLESTMEFYRKQKEVVTITNTVPVPKPYIPKWVWYLVAFNVGQLAWKFRFGISGLFTKVFRK